MNEEGSKERNEKRGRGEETKIKIPLQKGGSPVYPGLHPHTKEVPCCSHKALGPQGLDAHDAASEYKNVRNGKERRK